MAYEKLSIELQKIVNKRFKEPTLPQKLAIPPIMEGKNILLIAQTGSGKTESAMLPIIDFLMTGKKPIGALYITPLKSLNRDLLDRMIWWGDQTGIEVSVRHGDTSQYERRLQLEFPPNLMVTTPETMQPIITAKKFREHLRNVKYVILDEVHEMVDSKRGVQLTVALERLKELCGDFQLVMLSATVGHPEKVARFFAGGKEVQLIKADTAKKIEINVINPEPERIDEDIAEKVFTSKETAARLRTIMDLIKNSRSSLVFTNTRQFAEVLASRMKTLDSKFPVDIHHSSLSKEVRIKAEKDFKEEKLKALISTSSLQLGIDIGSVDLVIQYMSPREVTQLTQRVGRSGHELSKTSRGIVITTDIDDIFESAVIARKAVAHEFEDIDIHDKAYDVLAHQIIGMTLDFGQTEMERIYKVAKRAWPYRDLTYPEFLEVCSQLNNLGLVFLDGKINKKRRGFDYYFSQISTIPDVRNYKVYNMLDNSFVGVLDEEFIAVHGDPGTNFILKSEAYKIISVEEKKVMVEPIVDAEAAIPAWEGELIPVPYSIAQEVARIRGEIAKKLASRNEESIISEIMEKYPVDEVSARKMIDLIKGQKKFGVIPDEKTMLVEDYENIVVIHSPFGIKVNETLGRIISAMLTNRIGAVGLKTDPYRIMIQFQQKNMELVREVLTTTDPKHIRSYLEMSLSRSELFEWKFVHVAKRFGAFSREAQFGKIRMKKLVEDFAGTPIYQETLKEIEVEKLDVAKATAIIKSIQSGEISLVFKKGISPIGKIGLQHKYAEVIGPEKPEREIFDLFKKRIMSTQMRLICVNCGKWSQAYTVSKIKDSEQCPSCGSKLLASVNWKDTESQKIIQKGVSHSKMNVQEMKRYDNLKENGDLFMVYKRNAPITMSARGVGPTTAKRILARFHKDEDALLRDMLTAERLFVKNKKFWSA